MMKVYLVVSLLSMCLSQNFNTAFDQIYQRKVWQKGGNPPSGAGSVACSAIKYLIYLQHIVNRVDVKRIVEIGFGDWSMNQHLILQHKMYVGYEAATSRMRPTGFNTKFILLKTLADVTETGDLLIIKDVMQHWPNTEVTYLIEKILPKFKYAVITNDMVLGQALTTDTFYGGWRPIPKNLIKNTEDIMSIQYPGSIKTVLLFINPNPPLK